MGVEQFLAPGEDVKYTSQSQVNFQGDTYTVVITDRRIIWYKTRGLLFKKNSLVAVPIEQVKGIRYDEEGLIKKLAYVTISMPDRKYAFSGNRESMKAIYGELQAYQLMDRELHKPNGQTSQ